MENELPIYLQTCADCGRPALTFDDQDHALCAEHAGVFIPARGAFRGETVDEDTE